MVRLLGAVQAQEYPYSKWALALRMRRTADAVVEQAFASGAILRTHLMRATWHFVTPADIRWILALTGPRVRAALAGYDRKLGIDGAVIKRATRAIARALSGGAQLTRAELKVVLTGAGVRVDDTQRLSHVIMHAELTGQICSGARRGKQFTYALLDDRVPPAPAREREEALAELARRYFESHGPAQIQDFVWWSGLRAGDARAGLAMSRQFLADEIVDGRQYWFSASIGPVRAPRRAAFLLGPYDEYLIAYKDRSAAIEAGTWKAAAGRDPYAAPVVLDGQVVGGWRRTGDDPVSITLDMVRRLDRSDTRLIEEAAERYGRYFGVEVRFGTR